jgi:hypothetical protein
VFQQEHPPLCYLKAIHVKVPELVEKEKMGDGEGRRGTAGKIVQGDIEQKMASVVA